MDSSITIIGDDGSPTYQYVHKEPRLNVLFMYPEDWHNDAQTAIFQPYKFCFIAMLFVVFLLWLVLPFTASVRLLFFRVAENTGAADQNKKYR